MTIKELIEELEKYPEDATVVYRHNKYGRIDIDTIIFSEELLLSGNLIKVLTLEGTCKDNALFRVYSKSEESYDS